MLIVVGCSSHRTQATNPTDASARPQIASVESAHGPFVFENDGLITCLSSTNFSAHWVPPNSKTRSKDSRSSLSSNWVVVFRFSTIDPTGRIAFKPLGPFQLSKLIGSGGIDLRDACQMSPEGNAYVLAEAPFPTLSSFLRGYGDGNWPPQYGGRITLSVPRLPERISVLLGHQDFEVVTSSRVIECVLPDPTEWYEVEPGIRLRLVESAPGRGNMLEYEFANQENDPAPRMNLVEAMDGTGAFTALFESPVEQAVDGGIRGNVRQRDNKKLGNSARLRIHLIGGTKQIRMKVDIRDIPMHNLARETSSD